MNKKLRTTLIEVLIILVLVPAALILSWKVGERQYYLFSVIVMMLAMLPFFFRFERRKPSSRELVTLAVMSALAAASRVAFVMIPHFTPMTGLIMITGLALGAESGFIVGSLGAFVSNFFVGQGPWTPWQMFAYGLAGLLFGIMGQKRGPSEETRGRDGLLSGDRPLFAAVVGGLMVFLIIGPLLDTATLFLVSMQVNTESVMGVYMAGIPVNAMHAASTFVTILVLCRPVTEKLERIKVKYGMMRS